MAVVMGARAAGEYKELAVGTVDRTAGECEILAVDTVCCW